MTITITGSPVSWTRDSRPRWLLHELSIPFEHARVNIFAGEGRKPEHLAKHPFGKVPVLEEEGIHAWESGAVTLFLAEKYGEGKLIPPAGSMERARCYQWLFFAVTSLEPVGQKLFVAERFQKGKPGAEERAAEAKGELAKLRVALDPALEAHPYLAGEAFTVADIVLGVPLHWIAMVGGLEEGSPLHAYHERLAARPAFAATFAEPEG